MGSTTLTSSAASTSSPDPARMSTPRRILVLCHATATISATSRPRLGGEQLGLRERVVGDPPEDPAVVRPHLHEPGLHQLALGVGGLEVVGEALLGEVVG